MKEGKRYYFEEKSRETSKARVRGSARDAAEMSGWRARFDCTLSVHSTWFRFHARETGIKREREQERRWERRACTIEASFSRTSKRFCVLPWRGVSSRAIMQADSNGDLAFPITNFHRYLSRTLSTTRIFCKSRRYNFLVIFWYIKKEKKNNRNDFKIIFEEIYYELEAIYYWNRILYGIVNFVFVTIF